jgi:hypothetical protein
LQDSVLFESRPSANVFTLHRFFSIYLLFSKKISISISTQEGARWGIHVLHTEHSFYDKSPTYLKPFVIQPSASSHSIIESIVGEFATVLLTCSFVIRFSATSHIVHRPSAHPAKTAMVKRLQFGPACFFLCLAFASPERYIDDSRLIEPATEIDRDMFVAEYSSRFFMEPNSFLAWLISAGFT